jgi:hypothetical protein
MRITCVAIVLILSACAQAQEPSAGSAPSTVQVNHISTLPTTRDGALHVLETTEQFEDTAIGYAGIPSAEVCAFAILLKEPDAVQVFHSLLGRANVAGQRMHLPVFISSTMTCTRLRSPGIRAMTRRSAQCLGASSLRGKSATSFMRAGAGSSILTAAAIPSALPDSRVALSDDAT